jgi:superfamily II helicase
MKHPDGFRVNVTQVEQMPRDMTSIRMNVRDFDEAYELLKSKGFVNAQGDKITDTGSSVSTMMVSPTGFSISISEHLRKEEK